MPAPACDPTGKPYYGSDDACRFVEGHTAELKIEVISFPEMVYLPFEDEFRRPTSPRSQPAHLALRNGHSPARARGRRIPEWATFPEVIEELQKPTLRPAAKVSPFS